MEKLTCNKSGNGFPTNHRIKFNSRRTTIEGGYGLGADESVREYEGFLFQSTHFDTHLCVGVDHQEHWGRSDDWHGCVCRDNIICVTLVDKDGEPLGHDSLTQVADQLFLSTWGMLCNRPALSAEGSEA